MSREGDGERKILDRIRKLQELADRCEYGERINARKMIDELMEKYHISPDALDEERRERYQFTYSREWQRKLMFQLCALMGWDRVDVQFEAMHIAVRGRKKYRWVVDRYIVCTPLDWIDLVSRYEILKRDYARQLDTFYLAFRKRNKRLLPFDPSAPEPTAKEREEDERASYMAHGIERSILNKQLEAKGGEA